MARQAVVTKKSVDTGQSGLFQITLNLQYKEDETVLFDEDFSANHWLGRPAAEATVQILLKMQARIDRYKASETVYNAAALNTAVTAVQNALLV